MIEGQEDLLNRGDPRFFAIDFVGTGLGSFSTEEKINNVIKEFSLPSGSSLFLNLALKARKESLLFSLQTGFNIHPEGCWPDDHKALFDFFESMIAQIIFSYSAIESFVNISIPDHYSYSHTTSTGEKLIYKADQIERHIDLDTKLLRILPGIFKIATPKGDAVWGFYQDLKRLRNRIIHLKRVDLTRSDWNTKTIWGDLLRKKDEDYSDHAYKLIGHFLKKGEKSRWYKKYPYHF